VTLPEIEEGISSAAALDSWRMGRVRDVVSRINDARTKIERYAFALDNDSLVQLGSAVDGLNQTIKSLCARRGLDIDEGSGKISKELDDDDPFLLL